MIEACQAGDVAKVAELLGEDPSLVNAKSEKGESAILTAQYRMQRGVVELLLRNGAALTLHEACAVGALEKARDMVDSDPASVNTLAADGFPPLALASFFGHTEVAELLLARGAQANTASTNSMKVTALHAAAAGRHVAICAMLLQHGADPNARQHGGFTPLHAAAANGQEDLVRMLLERGADCSLKSEAGHTAHELATERGHLEVAKLL